MEKAASVKGCFRVLPLAFLPLTFLPLTSHPPPVAGDILAFLRFADLRSCFSSCGKGQGSSNLGFRISE